jgi:hypothetical protein
MYKYCTNCTVYNWTVLTIITHKLLLHVQLHNSTQTANLISSQVECSQLFVIVCVYRQSYPEIRSFKHTLLTTSAVTQFNSDNEQADVTKITDKMCKLKANWITVNFKCRFVQNKNVHWKVRHVNDQSRTPAALIFLNLKSFVQRHKEITLQKAVL